MSTVRGCKVAFARNARTRAEINDRSDEKHTFAMVSETQIIHGDCDFAFIVIKKKNTVIYLRILQT